VTVSSSAVYSLQLENACQPLVSRPFFKGSDKSFPILQTKEERLPSRVERRVEPGRVAGRGGDGDPSPVYVEKRLPELLCLAEARRAGKALHLRFS
jgi:hypothetical protein